MFWRWEKVSAGAECCGDQYTGRKGRNKGVSGKGCLTRSGKEAIMDVGHLRPILRYWHAALENGHSRQYDIIRHRLGSCADLIGAASQGFPRDRSSKRCADSIPCPERISMITHTIIVYSAADAVLYYYTIQ